MGQTMRRFVQFLLAALAVAVATACTGPVTPKSATGVSQTTAEVQLQASGLTVEQENIRERLKRDNTPGSIKHLYVIAPTTGQVLIYSTVRGKVTSSGKRLTPTTVGTNMASGDGCTSGMGFSMNGEAYCTDEIIQDDGTYGSSIPYLYWISSNGTYHQHYVTGAEILHISDQPLRVPSVILNLEVASADTSGR